MKLRFVAALSALVLLPSCGEDEGEVVVTETRRVTMRDVAPKLNASSDERFRNTQPSPVSAPTPDGWLALPATEFRLLNYRFGDDGRGEVSVSIASGGLADNLNRWLSQFALEPLDVSNVADLKRVKVGGEREGFWIEAEGTYNPGMGNPPRTDYALAGIIVESDKSLLTIKMIGPVADVQAQKDQLKAFAASLTWNSH